jgi:ubiquinone/menaquinone biosynthesis C-methylase UbiE
MKTGTKTALTTLAVSGVWGIGAYVVDVIIRPHLVARRARAAAAKRGKPLLNVGAGTRRSSVRAILLGPTLWGDTNVDIAARKGKACTQATVCYGDAHRLPFADKEFGALIASHVLEHVKDPEAAMAEFHRVADQVFVITPRWWAPHTWLHPGHRWYVTSSGGFVPLYQSKRARAQE